LSKRRNGDRVGRQDQALKLEGGGKFIETFEKAKQAWESERMHLSIRYNFKKLKNETFQKNNFSVNIKT
jgi:hypothetical protein